ncbi:MAG: hypothetical protein J4G00_08270 [Actinomycetia bacterium]|nr:hypothetical protein [Actinomycetes bacterium]
MRLVRGQGGSITIWLLGLGICLLVLGGLGLDLWSVVIMRSRLSGLAEATATAAASGISEERWRRTGQVHLDPVRAEELGRSFVSQHPSSSLLDGPAKVVVSPDRRSVSVQVWGSTRLVLLRLVSESDRIQVAVTSTAVPHVVG